MSLKHEFMMDLTKAMPMKQIDVNGPYLQRYYAGTFADGSDLWFHRFMQADGDRHLHNHPFDAQAVMIAGSYLEELRGGVMEARFPASNPLLDNEQCVGLTYARLLASLAALGSEAPKIPAVRTINVFHWHRIAEIEPDTWTAMIVKPDRLPYWYFEDENGELVPMKASEKEWWKNYGTRAEYIV